MNWAISGAEKKPETPSMGEPRKGSPSGGGDRPWRRGQSQKHRWERRTQKDTWKEEMCRVGSGKGKWLALSLQVCWHSGHGGDVRPLPEDASGEGGPRGQRPGLRRAREGFPDRQGCTRPAPLWAGLEMRWSPICPNANHGRGLKALEGPLGSPESPRAAVRGGE